MFQTNLHVWLQSWDNEWTLRFFRVITSLGYTEFFIVSLILIIFGIHFRKGFVLLLIVMWTTLVTEVLKETFTLPRPFMVEKEVKLLDDNIETDVKLLDNAGATHFFDVLPSSTVQYFKDKDIRPGLPSGHTSIAVAFWGSIILLFRRRWLTILCSILLFLIPFSRMYLGVHFLADILSGYIVGGVMLLCFYRVVIHPKALSRYLKTDKYALKIDMVNCMVLIAPFLWLLIIKDADFWIVPAVLIGFGFGFLLLSQKSLPNETGTILNRTKKSVSALILFVGLMTLFEKLFSVIGFDNKAFADFVNYLLVCFITIWFGTKLHLRLGWSSPERHKEPATDS